MTGTLAKTYRQMLDVLSKMNDEQLDANITIEDHRDEEFHPAELRITSDDSVLDSGTPVIYLSNIE